MAFIYGLRQKDLTEYFYIGSTKFEVAVRFAQHISDVERGTHTNAHFMNKVIKMGVENITFDVLSEVDENYRYIAESEWIQRLHDTGHHLVNWCYHPDKYHRIETEAPDPYTPQKLLYGYLNILDCSPQVASDHNQQWLMDALHRIIEDTIKHMLAKYPNETWKDLLYAARQV